MLQIKTKDNKTFEDIKHIDENGNEYWLARELQPVLEYAKWERFKDAVNRAKVACELSQHPVSDHFADVGKSVEMAIGGKAKLGIPDVGKSEKKTRYIADYDCKLSRYACYLTVMNGDPRKEVIALGQTYFAVKTRQQEYQELFNRLSEDDRRLFLRSDVKHKNMLLADAAKKAGIKTNFEYAEFQDFGYMGLYGGLKAKDIAKRKNIDNNKEEILDYMGSEELGANLFRITQTEAVMRRNNTATPKEANAIHYKIGSGIRKTIKEFGNTMPENLPTPDKSTKQLEKERVKKIKKDKK